jgi:hypothetical protein
MPEEPEVETERLREMVDDELERDGGSFLRRVALTTAVLAAFAAVAALRAGDTVNEALVLKTDATRLQALASDHWAHYQAKGIKLAIAESSQATWRAAEKEPPVELAQLAARYRGEQDEIEREARARETERDERSHEADLLLERHHKFALAVAFFQLAIALGAVAALTRMRIVWLGSLGVALIGLVLLSWPFVS